MEWGAQQPSRQENNRGDQRQHTVHGYSNNTKWKEQKPNDWVENQRDQCQGPAQDKQDAP
jgi:hypothetical protein